MSQPSDRPAAAEAVVNDRLDPGEVRVVFQPVVDIHKGELFAYEALVRVTSPNYKGPPHLFEEAVAQSCAGALGRVIRQLAVERCVSYPLFLNIHPNEFDEGWLVRPDDPVFHHEHAVFLELTESVPLAHFAKHGAVLRELRGKGIRLAIDDLGAGYSNLKYIADLQPEVVKLDRELIANLSFEPRLQTLVTAIVRLCEDLGAEVVAEGIETSEEFQAVQDTGAHYGQGYLIARPAAELVEISDLNV